MAEDKKEWTWEDYVKAFAKGIWILYNQTFPFADNVVQIVDDEQKAGSIEELAFYYDALLSAYPEELLLGYLMAQVDDPSLTAHGIGTTAVEFLQFLHDDPDDLFYEHFYYLLRGENPVEKNDSSGDKKDLENEEYEPADDDLFAEDDS